MAELPDHELEYLNSWQEGVRAVADEQGPGRPAAPTGVGGADRRVGTIGKAHAAEDHVLPPQAGHRDGLQDARRRQRALVVPAPDPGSGPPLRDDNLQGRSDPTTRASPCEGTGGSEAAGGCILRSGAGRHGVRVLCVVLGHPDGRSPQHEPPTGVTRHDDHHLHPLGHADHRAGVGAAGTGLEPGAHDPSRRVAASPPCRASRTPSAWQRAEERPETGRRSVSGSGVTVSWDGAAWSSPSVYYPAPATGPVTAPVLPTITCTSGPLCVIVDGSGHVSTGDGTNWSNPVPLGRSGTAARPIPPIPGSGTPAHEPRPCPAPRRRSAPWWTTPATPSPSAAASWLVAPVLRRGPGIRRLRSGDRPVPIGTGRGLLSHPDLLHRGGGFERRSGGTVPPGRRRPHPGPPRSLPVPGHRSPSPVPPSTSAPS